MASLTDNMRPALLDAAHRGAARLLVTLHVRPGVPVFSAGAATDQIVTRRCISLVAVADGVAVPLYDPGARVCAGDGLRWFAVEHDMLVRALGPASYQLATADRPPAVGDPRVRGVARAYCARAQRRAIDASAVTIRWSVATTGYASAVDRSVEAQVTVPCAISAPAPPADG